MDSGLPKTGALHPDPIAGSADPIGNTSEVGKTCAGECACDHDHNHDGLHDARCGCDCQTDHASHTDADYDPEDESFLGEGAPTVDEAAPELINELAAACVRFVHDTIQIELDYTPETLPLLDHYLGVARKLIGENVELRELVLRAAGAYFGEVLRRRLNGYWQIGSEDVHSWRVCGRHVLLSINPVGVIAEAIAESADSDGPSGILRLARADQDDVTQRLSEIPPLPENEFFLTSTRLEVIDVVIEHLRLRMEQNDHGDMEFDLDDYASDLKSYGSA